MTVQAGMSDEMWQWLMDKGWREPHYYPDRRHYRDIPSNWVTTLIDADAQDREAVLVSATTKAVTRPDLHDAEVLRSRFKHR